MFCWIKSFRCYYEFWHNFNKWRKGRDAKGTYDFEDYVREFNEVSKELLDDDEVINRVFDESF